MKTNKYDNDSVVACTECLSLAIKVVEGHSICNQCGNDTIREHENIKTWDAEFVEKYGVSYMEW